MEVEVSSSMWKDLKSILKIWETYILVALGFLFGLYLGGKHTAFFEKKSKSNMVFPMPRFTVQFDITFMYRIYVAILNLSSYQFKRVANSWWASKFIMGDADININPFTSNYDVDEYNAWCDQPLTRVEVIFNKCTFSNHCTSHSLFFLQRAWWGKPAASKPHYNLLPKKPF